MALNDLKDVYLDQLRDIHSADRQALAATRSLADAATNSELVKALKDSIEGTEKGISEIADLCARHGIEPGGEHCKGMQGLAAEARAHGIDAEFGADAARDAMIISQYQRMVHYALAGYGCLAAFAKQMGLDEDHKVLKRCLDHCYDGDRRMTAIAETKGVNAGAAAA